MINYQKLRSNKLIKRLKKVDFVQQSIENAIIQEVKDQENLHVHDIDYIIPHRCKEYHIITIASIEEEEQKASNARKLL